MRKVKLHKVLDKAYFVGGGKLHKVYLELTHRCNFRCKHCYIREDCDADKLLTLGDHKKLAKELLSLGTIDVIFTGGEPLLHPLFFDIYQIYRKKGFLITVMTNGSLINDRCLSFIRRYPPKAIEISLYGMVSESIKNVTGTETAPRLVCDVVKNLASGGLAVYLKAVLTKANLHDISAIDSFAQTMNLPFRFETAIHPRIDKSFPAREMRLSTNEAINVISNYVKKRKGKTKREPLILNRKTNDGIPRFRCGIGTYSMVIDPYGFMEPCLIVRKKRWRFPDFSVESVLAGGFQEIRKTVRKKEIKCDSCRFVNDCAFCEGMFQLFKDKTLEMNHYCKIINSCNSLEKEGSCEIC